MSSPKTTIRLQNLSPGNLSLHLHQLRSNTAGSLRRGPMLTPILIPLGLYYDVCAQLNVDFEEAERICQRSPEVQSFKASRRLAQNVFPPPAEAPAPVPAAPMPPAAEPTSIATEPTPDVASAAPEPKSVEAAIEVATTSEPLPLLSEDLLTEIPATTATVPAAAEGSTTWTARESPSMDWSEDALREYAEKRGLDLSKAKSKTAVLRVIRGVK